MYKPEVGEFVLIHSYKHDGSIHRCWDKGLVLDATDEHVIVINNKTLVTEADGRIWYTKEPAICYFPTNEWYNIICMIRNSGVYFYCNIASPTLWDGQALKYIDYDLDLKVFPDYRMRVLDEDEYKVHRFEMNYSLDIDSILRKQLNELKEMARTKTGPFKIGFAQHWYSKYLELTK